MTTPPPENWDECIPEYPYADTEHMEGAVEAIKDHIGIVDAYRRWCGKMEPRDGRVESIMCSCPMPLHEDKNPSAWMNSDLNVWFCAACEVGGDAIDIGAMRYGFDLDNYKQTDFREVITILLADLGLDVGQFIHQSGDPDPEREKVVEKPIPQALRPLAYEDDVDIDVDFLAPPEFNWKALIDKGTFMDHWMTATSVARVPDEFLFFLGLQMIALACGPDVQLKGGDFPMAPNFNIALLGETGIGKSLAVSAAQKVLREALPWEELDANNKGVRVLGRPGSGEALYQQFAWEPPTSVGPVTVRGWVEIDELSELMSASQRQGSVLREAIIKISDGRGPISHVLRANSIHLAKPYACLITGVQPAALANILTDHDVTGGFANRFLYVRGTPKPLKPWGEQKATDTTGVSVFLRKIHNWSARGRAVTVAPSALPTINEYLEELEVLKKSHGVLARIDYLAKKLLMVIAANQESDVITTETIQRARIMTNFLTPGSDIIYNEVNNTDYNRLYLRILKIVEWYPSKHGCHPSLSQILQGFSGAERKKRKVQIIKMVGEMAGRDKSLIPMPPTREDLNGLQKGEKPATRYGIPK